MENKYVRSDFINVQEAVFLLYKYDMRIGDDDRAAKDRTSKLIKSHIKKNKLKTVDGILQVGVLIDWAVLQKSFKDKSIELPSTYEHQPVGGVKFSGNANMEFVKAPPTSLPECHSAILELLIEVKKLEDENILLKTQNSILQSDADKFKEICRKNKESSKKQRRR